MIYERFQTLKFAVFTFFVIELFSSAIMFISEEFLFGGAYRFINDLIPSMTPALSLIFKTAYISIPSSIILVAIIWYRDPIKFVKRRVTTTVCIIAIGAFAYYLGCFVWYYDAINELEVSQRGNWCGTPYFMEIRNINYAASTSLIISQFVFKAGIAGIWMLDAKI